MNHTLQKMLAIRTEVFTISSFLSPQGFSLFGWGSSPLAAVRNVQISSLRELLPCQS